MTKCNKCELQHFSCMITSAKVHCETALVLLEIINSSINRDTFGTYIFFTRMEKLTLDVE